MKPTATAAPTPNPGFSLGGTTTTSAAGQSQSYAICFIKVLSQFKWDIRDGAAVLLRSRTSGEKLTSVDYLGCILDLCGTLVDLLCNIQPLS